MRITIETTELAASPATAQQLAEATIMTSEDAGAASVVLAGSLDASDTAASGDGMNAGGPSAALLEAVAAAEAEEMGAAGGGDRATDGGAGPTGSAN